MTADSETPPRKRAVPRRGEFKVWRQATTRWADDDVYGHMNNARYCELIDTAVNAHLAEATGVDIRSLPAIGVVAEVSCRFFREMGYPTPCADPRGRRTPAQAVTVSVFH